MARPKSNKKTPSYFCTMQISKKCCDANGMQEETDFYRSYSAFNKNGRFHICKHCIKDFVYTKNGKIDMRNFKAILRVLDLPYLTAVFEDAMNSKHEFIGTYFKLVALNYKDLTWESSDDVDNQNINPFEDDMDLYEKWGNYSLEDLGWLEKNYHEWVTNHDCDKLSTRKLIMMICIKELEIRRAREKNLPTDKMEKTLLDLLNSGNLTPRTMNYTNESESTKVFGAWLRDIEKTRPAEYFEDKSLYDDFDGIKSYIERFLFRPMKNLISGSREFDKEFQPLEFENAQDDEGDDDNE